MYEGHSVDIDEIVSGIVGPLLSGECLSYFWSVVFVGGLSG